MRLCQKIYWCYDKQKNNVMLNSDFYKIIYSDNLCTFNFFFVCF